MRIWTVHTRSARAPELVREGFSWGALLVGPLWLLAFRAWIPAGLLFAAWLLLGAIVPPQARGAVSPALMLAAGFFGRDWIRWALELRGYALSGVIAARDEEAAFVRVLATRPDLIPAAAGRLA